MSGRKHTQKKNRLVVQFKSQTFAASGDEMHAFALHPDLRKVFILRQKHNTLHCLEKKTTHTEMKLQYFSHMRSTKRFYFIILCYSNKTFSQFYLIDRYSSLGFPTLQVPHCTDLVSARTTNKAQN